MQNFQRVKPVEKITLEIEHRGWIALSIGSCGIVANAGIGRHERRYRECQSIALDFAQLVVQKIGFPSSQEYLSLPSILIDTADAVIDDPAHVDLICTVWQYLSGAVEICSVGTNSVLVFEGGTVQEIITPQTVNELLRSQGQTPKPLYRKHVTHALGSQKSERSCHVDDIRVALVPLLPTTTIAIIEERFLVDAILEQAVPRSELSSFMDTWNPPWGKKLTMSVLISL